MIPGEGECCVFCAFGDIACLCVQRQQLGLRDE